MSNPLDRHLETLKGAKPRPEAVDRAVASLHRPHPSRLVPLTVGVAALSAILLWPHPGSGYAWTQVVAQPTPPLYILRKTVVRNGRVEPWITIWHDRAADAHRVREQNTVAPPFDTMETIHSRQGRYVHRYLGYATYTKHAGKLPVRDADFMMPEELVRSPQKGKVEVERDIDTRVGKADRFTIERRNFMFDPATQRLREFGRSKYVVYVAPGTTRLLGWEEAIGGTRYEATVEYPERLDPSIFKISPVAGLRLYDLDRIKTAALRELTVSSRLVVQDANLRAWVFSSGRARPSVLGALPGAKVWSLKDYNGMGTYGWRSPYTAVGVRLRRPVERIDLLLGEKRLRNVPVLQVDNLESVASVLRMRPLHGSPVAKPIEIKAP